MTHGNKWIPGDARGKELSPGKAPTMDNQSPGGRDAEVVWT